MVCDQCKYLKHFMCADCFCNLELEIQKIRKDCQVRQGPTKQLIIESGSAAEFRSPNFIKLGLKGVY